MDVIYIQIKNDFVSIIDYRNYRDKNKCPQIVAYYNCIHINKNNCKCISFIDIVEFRIIDFYNITISNY